MEIMKYKTNTIVSWDLQGKEEQHVRWRPYFRDTAYLILVIDSADYEYINVARDELHQLLSESDLSCAHLLVYANKSDLTNAMSIAKIIDELELDSVKDRRWKVEQTCATTGVGLFEEWKHGQKKLFVHLIGLYYTIILCLLCKVLPYDSRSKFNRDETKKYELVLYKPIEPILQEGPQCGIVALAMAMNNHSCNVKVQSIFEKAKELLYTIQGELFDARVIPHLCEQFNLTATVHQWAKVTDLVDCLQSGCICLVPYDSDANHEPCLKKGHRAHWLLVHGYLKELTSSPSNEYDLVLVQHGKSKFLGAFSMLDLFQSNGQLVDIDPKRRIDSEYCLPKDASLKETLCNLFVAI
ncbi:unnamed protein product [Adineta ricciae]|uniref:Actin maturation protease n=1 Tax=Adineta ricciae TaxID=249248 RepID=A0A814J967_ADIRI|nr:unnamed protein product [Adineta ricciae]